MRQSHFAFLLAFAGFLFALPIFAADKVRLSQHVPAAVARLRPTGRLAADHKLQLAIGLPLRKQAELDAFIESLQDPNSPNFRRFISPQEFAEKFGPTKDDYDAVKDFAKAHHLRITHQHRNRVVLDVEGAAGDVENAFGVTLQVFNHPTEHRTFFAPDADPTVDVTLPIIHITGLNNYSLPHPKYHVKAANTPEVTPRTGSGPGGAYWGNDFRKAYVPGTVLDGRGQTIALLQFDGFYANDISAYESHTGLPRVPMTIVPVDGGVISPTDGNGEVSLDIEMSVAMAPGLSRIYVYEAPNPSPWPDLLSAMANDNLAKQLSCSWGGGGPDPTCEEIFKQMAAQGQTFFNASGDNDAFTGAIDFPSESTNIVQVGGTTLTTSSSGSYISETVWNWGGGTGSSGGISETYPLPAYQQGISMTKNGGSTQFRNIPDVALTADNVYVNYDNGSSDVFGGTSCAAPLWAGLTALINQQADANSQPPVGFINPAVYAIGKSAGFARAFHDITTGNNTSSGSPNQFYAVPGYDLCTGWGTPTSGLIDALAGPPDVLLISPASGFTANGPVGGPYDASSQTFTLTNSSSASLNWQASSDASWLSLSSASGTISAGASSQTIVGLTPAAYTLAEGTYIATVSFTNKTSGIVQNREFTLLVLGAPVINAQPESQTANQGDTVTFSVTATGLTTLNYQWNFNDTPIAGQTASTLTLNSVTGADSGTYNVVVSNSVGATTSSNAVLIVNGSPPNDDCSGALSIEVENYTNIQSTLLATSTGDPTPSCAFEFGNAVWYKWTAPADGVVTVDTIGSSFDTVLGVYSGSCDALTHVGCNDDGGGNLTSLLTHPVTAGVTYYYVVGGYSSAAGQLVFHFNVVHSLAFDSQPVNEPAPLGGNVTFSAAASGGQAPLKYQWYSTRNNGVSGTKLINQVATSCIEHVATNMSPGYYVVVTDSSTPPNVITSLVGKVMFYVAPRFVLQPISQTRIAGNNVTFHALAVGSAPLTYQWNFQGNDIAGATKNVLTQTNVQSGDTGHYQCVVNGAFGSSAMTGLMRGNLVVSPDTNKPIVAILRPARGSLFTNGVHVAGETNIAPELDIFGRAWDSGLITNVSLIWTFPTNAQPPATAALSGSTPNMKMFSAHVTLVPGRNSFTAVATDSAGNSAQSSPVTYYLKTR